MLEEAGMAGTLRFLMHRAEPWAAGRIPGSELFLRSILASAGKETPVLVSASVFLLKTSSGILPREGCCLRM